MPLIVLVCVVLGWLQIVVADAGTGGGFFNGLLEGLLERAAKGMETELPEPPPPYRGPPVQKYTERRFIRSESNF